MSSLHVAIIGANGFIGKHLTDVLSQSKNINLYLFGKREQSIFHAHLPYQKIDLQNESQLKTQFANVDLIYYLASETIPLSSWDNPLLEIEHNLKPFIQFCSTVAQLKTKKIIFISSAGTVYGPSEEKVDEVSVTRPFSPYGIVKLAMENFLSYFEKKYQVGFDVYRVSNVYGAGQDTSKGLGIINTFLEKIIAGKKIVIFGNGESVRNYIYVKDVAKFLSLACTRQLNTSHIYNLSSSNTLSINELLSIMKNNVSERVEAVYEESRNSDNTMINLDNNKLVKDFPEVEFTPIEAGIKETYEHLKKQLIQI